MHFESDSLILSNVIQCLCNPLIAISNVVTGICHRLQVFKFVLASHVRCGGNKPTHILARYAKGISSFVTWVKYDPIVIDTTRNPGLGGVFFSGVS